MYFSNFWVIYHMYNKKQDSSSMAQHLPIMCQALGSKYGYFYFLLQTHPHPPTPLPPHTQAHTWNKIHQIFIHMFPTLGVLLRVLQMNKTDEWTDRKWGSIRVAYRLWSEQSYSGRLLTERSRFWWLLSWISQQSLCSAGLLGKSWRTAGLQSTLECWRSRF